MRKRITSLLLGLTLTMIIPVSQFIASIWLFIGIGVNIAISNSNFGLSDFSTLSVTDMTNALGDTIIYAQIFSYVLSAIAIVFILRALRINLSEENILRKTNYKILILPVFAAVGYYAFQLLITGIFANLLNDSMNKYSLVVEQMFLNMNIYLLILAVGIVGPIVEELLVRGLIFNYLKKHYAVWAALILQALLFGFMHLNMFQFTYAFFIGIALGLVYMRTKSLWAPIIFHMINNLIALMLTQIEIKEEYFVDIIIPIGLLIFIIFYILMGTKKSKSVTTN